MIIIGQDYRTITNFNLVEHIWINENENEKIFEVRATTHSYDLVLAEYKTMKRLEESLEDIQNDYVAGMKRHYMLLDKED